MYQSPYSSNRKQERSLATQPTAKSRSRSFRHIWQSLRHALTWQQLRQTFHYKNVLNGIRKHWFAPTVIVLLAIIAYRHVPPFWNRTPPAFSEGEYGGSGGSRSSMTADLSPSFADDESEAEEEQQTKNLDLPADLPTPKSKAKNNEWGNKTQQQYIRRFVKVAQDEQKKYRIPASVILGLSILCSEFGTSDLAQQYNNFFSMLCEHNKFYTDAQLITKKESCYVKYPTAWASFRANSMLITSGAFKELPKIAKNDYQAWASGLEKIGYPHPNYSADALVHLIETYNLKQYDK